MDTWLGHGELSDGVVVYLAFEFRHRPLHREKGEEVCVEKGGRSVFQWRSRDDAENTEKGG